MPGFGLVSFPYDTELSFLRPSSMRWDLLSHFIDEEAEDGSGEGT